MKILTLGGTGATGQLFIDAALAGGHEIIAYGRSPERLPERHRLRVVKGEVRDADTLAEAAGDVDVIVSALGHGSVREPSNLILDATRASIAAAERARVRRIVFLSAFGIGESKSKGSDLIQQGYKLGQSIFEDKEAGEILLTNSDLDWTLAYPGVLTDGPRSGTVTVIDLKDLGSLPGVPHISRADVADFLLSAAANDSWIRRTAVLYGELSEGFLNKA